MFATISELAAVVQDRLGLTATECSDDLVRDVYPGRYEAVDAVVLDGILRDVWDRATEEPWPFA